MKIIVTGATGFIGSHLTEICVKGEFDVVAFDRYNPNNDWGWLEESKCNNNFEVILGDICDNNSVSKAMKGCISITSDIANVLTICIYILRDLCALDAFCFFWPQMVKNIKIKGFA